MFSDKNEITSLYNPKELLQEKWTDFDIMRSKPLIFNIKGFSLAVMPLTLRDHPRFLKSLSHLIIRYYEIFGNIQFLSASLQVDRHDLDRIIEQVTLFGASKNYTKFITRDCVSFVREFSFRVVKGEYRTISRFAARQFIMKLTPEELLQIFFTIIVFNHDIVKKKTLGILAKLGIKDVLGVPTNSLFSPSIASNTLVYQFPKYSDEPFSRETLSQLEEQSKLN